KTSNNTVVPDRGAPRTKIGLDGAGLRGRTGAATRSTRPRARRRRRLGAAQESSRPLSVRSFARAESVTESLWRTRTTPPSSSPLGRGSSVEVVHQPDTAEGRQGRGAGVDPEGLVVALVPRERVGVDGALALRPELQRLAGPVDPLGLRVTVAAAVPAGVALHAAELADEQALVPVHRGVVRRTEDLPERRPMMLRAVREARPTVVAVHPHELVPGGEPRCGAVVAARVCGRHEDDDPGEIVHVHVVEDVSDALIRRAEVGGTAVAAVVLRLVMEREERGLAPVPDAG